MKSKLYKTHRKASYYRLRRLGYFSMSLMIATIIVVVPLTLAQAGTPSSSTSTTNSTSETTSSVSPSESTSSEVTSSSEATSGETSSVTTFPWFGKPDLKIEN